MAALQYINFPLSKAANHVILYSVLINEKLNLEIICQKNIILLAGIKISSLVEVVVVVVVGRTVGSISSKTLAYDCLCTLELCTTSMIATSSLGHLGDFLPSACPNCS